MGRRNHKKHAKKSSEAKEKDATGNKEKNKLPRESVVGHLLTNGWVQNSTIAFLGSLVLLIAAMATKTQVKAAAIGFASMGTIALWILTAVVIRYSSESAELRDNSVRFKVLRAMIPSNAYSSLFWVRYRVGSTDTLSPMPIALDAVITNIRQTPVTLDRIGVEMRENNSQWIRLQHIPTLDQRVYWIYGDPRTAGLMDFSTNGLDQLLHGKRIAPNVPIRGWLFFERPDNMSGTEGNAIQYRFTAEDTEGNVYEATTPAEAIKKEVRPPDDFIPDPAELHTVPITEDLSGLVRRRWHDVP